MSTADNSPYLKLQTRQAAPVEASYEARDCPAKKAQYHAWTPVNKLHAAGKFRQLESIFSPPCQGYKGKRPDGHLTRVTQREYEEMLEREWKYRHHNPPMGLLPSKPFYAEDLWPAGCSETTDDELGHLLPQANNWHKESLGPASRLTGADELPDVQSLTITADAVELQGKLMLQPRQSHGLILLVQSSGHPSQSPQHDLVSRQLEQAGFSTLRLGLLTEDEDVSALKSRHLRFDIPLLTRRLTEATQWVMHELATDHQSIGFYSSCTGTAAVLKVASVFDQPIKAIVSLSGRPDLAGEALARITAPTLLLMGGQDIAIMDLNVNARLRMRHGLVRIELIPQASHLFEEEGALERAARLATNWFQKYFIEHQPRDPSLSGHHRPSRD